MSEKIVNFRVDEKVKKEFEIIAASEDQTLSQMLRAYMRYVIDDYMIKNNQLEVKPVKKITSKGSNNGRKNR